MKNINQLNTMLVCLDLTEIDHILIEYANFLTQALEMDKIIFFHAIQAYDLPDKSSKKFPDLESNLSKRIESEVNDLVSGHFKRKTKMEVITKIEDEDAADMVINFIRKEEIHLTLIGQKFGEDRQAHYAHKITTQALSHLMFIPENPELSVDKIFCAIDLSKPSERAFQMALEMTKTSEGKLVCHYVYDTQKSYFPVTTLRARSSLEKKILKRFGKFVGKFDLKPEDIEFTVNMNEAFKSQAEMIYEAAEEQEAKLMIIGAKGRTSAVTSLLGNISERLRRMEKEIPVMIVKNI